MKYNSADAIYENKFLWSKDKTAIICAPIDISGEYVVPSFVKELKSGAFTFCRELKSVEMTNSVQSIEPFCFDNCANLERVKLSENLKTLSGFSNCPTLELIEIPNSVTSIGDYAFYCSGISYIDIPESVTTIGECALAECKYLSVVKMKDSVTELGNKAFYNSGKRVYDGPYIQLSNRISRLEKDVFGESRYFSFILPSSLTYLDNDAFYGCSRYKIAYPQNFDINNWAASHNTSILISYNPEEDVIVDGYIFSNDKKTIKFAPGTLCTLKYNIPSFVQNIGESSFALSGVSTISLHKDILNIGNNAFSGCYYLTDIKYNTNNPITADKSIFSESIYKNKNVTLWVPVGQIKKFYSTEPWLYFYNIKEAYFAGVDDVIADEDGDVPTEVYNLSGVRVGDTTEDLPAGMYIVRRGNKVTKEVIR